MQLEPILKFSGVRLLQGSVLLKGQFLNLPPVGTNKGQVVLLDGDSAGFRDDFLSIRVYLVEAHKEKEIPTPMQVGPRLLHLERSVKPWVAMEAFQETLPGSSTEISSTALV